MRRGVCGLVSAVAIFLISLQAQAALMSHFFYDGIGGPDVVFHLPTSSTPDTTNAVSFGFLVVPFNINGNQETGAVVFRTASNGGGMDTGFLSSDIDGFGLQVFSGTTAAPTFLDGSYDLRGGSQTGPIIGTLTITSSLSESIPEPATLAMLGSALLGLAFARRRKAA